MVAEKARDAGKAVRFRRGPAPVTGEYAVERHTTAESDVGEADGAR